MWSGASPGSADAAASSAQTATGSEDILCPDCRRELAIAVEREQRRRVRTPLSFWLQSPTVWLIAINVLIYVAMCGSALQLTPGTGRLLRWGANFGPSTLTGQWWRLLTATFLHAGIAHLLLNMWAFLNLGVLAELLFGKRHFVALYFFCGLGGSVASVWWHPDAVGVGASGAIFGVAGALMLALAFPRNRQMRTAMRGQLASVAFFVFYNIAFGATAEKVDNAAHLGGLLTGAILGVLLPSGIPVPAPQEPADLAESRHHPGRWRAALAFGLVALLLLGLAMSARRQNAGTVSLEAVRRALRNGNPALAIQETQRLLDRHPDFAEGHFMLGALYLQRDQLDDAVKELQRAVQLKPQLAEAQAQLCVVQLRRRAAQQALPACKQAVALNPGDSDGQYNLGLVYLALRDYGNAVSAFRKAAEAKPHSADENYRLALALFLNGDRQQAETQLESLLRIDPNYPGAQELRDALRTKKK